MITNRNSRCGRPSFLFACFWRPAFLALYIVSHCLLLWICFWRVGLWHVPIENRESGSHHVWEGCSPNEDYVAFLVRKLVVCQVWYEGCPLPRKECWCPSRWRSGWWRGAEGGCRWLRWLRGAEYGFWHTTATRFRIRTGQSSIETWTAFVWF